MHIGQARPGTWHLTFFDWKNHPISPGLPSIFPLEIRDSPLRPELIEAIFYLSLALPGDAMVFEMVRRPGPGRANQ